MGYGGISSKLKAYRGVKKAGSHRGTESAESFFFAQRLLNFKLFSVISVNSARDKKRLGSHRGTESAEFFLRSL